MCCAAVDMARFPDHHMYRFMVRGDFTFGFPNIVPNVQLTLDHGVVEHYVLCLQMDLISWEIHVNDIPDQWNLHDGCTQSCCFPVEEDMNGNHCRDLIFAYLTKPLHDSGQVNNVIGRILGILSMQQQEIFVGTHMTLTLSLALERFSNYSNKTTTRHLCMIS